MDRFFPAGEESEGSGDEWDIGTSYKRTPLVQVRSEVFYFAKRGANLASSVNCSRLSFAFD